MVSLNISGASWDAALTTFFVCCCTGPTSCVSYQSYKELM